MRNFIHRYFIELFNGNGNEQQQQIANTSSQITSLNHDVTESRDVTVGFFDVEGGQLTTTNHISVTTGGISGLPVSDLSTVDYDQSSIGSFWQAKYSQGANTYLRDDSDELVVGVDVLEAEYESRNKVSSCEPGTTSPGDEGVNNQGVVLCTICMCAVRNPVRLPCNHVFCTRPCLQSWVHRSDYCPNCRALIIIKSDKGKNCSLQSAALQCSHLDTSSSSSVDALNTSFMTIYPTDEQHTSPDPQLNSSFIILENSNTPATAISGQGRADTSGSRHGHSSSAVFTLVSQFGREKYERLKLSLHLVLLWSLFALFLFLFFLIYQHHMKHGKLNSNHADSIANDNDSRGDNFNSYLASFPSIV